MNEAFFTLHRGLPREGPGDRESLDWALSLARVAPDARILDAGCGPGADIEGLLAHAPEGHVTALDAHGPFVEQVRADWRGDARVTPVVGDMADPGGPYDLIWSAGALYFLGIEAGLRVWRKALAPGGKVVFSELCWLVETPDAEVSDWLGAEYPAIGGEADLRAHIAAAGYRVLGTKVLGDGAWEAYFQPIETRAAALRPGADAALVQVLNEAMREIDMWRRFRRQFGYVLAVVEPA